MLATGSAVTTRYGDGVLFNLLLKGETVILPTQARDRREENSNNQRFTQVVALQARLESLHAAKILSDEELYALEDVIADDAEEALRGPLSAGAKKRMKRAEFLARVRARKATRERKNDTRTEGYKQC